MVCTSEGDDPNDTNYTSLKTMARALPNNPNLLSLWTNGTNYDYTSVNDIEHKDDLIKNTKLWESYQEFLNEMFDYQQWVPDGNSRFTLARKPMKATKLLRLPTMQDVPG